MPKGFGARSYQQWDRSGDLVSFQVKVQETDLMIRARENLAELAEQAVKRYRQQIETYIHTHPEFQTSLTPMAVDETAPPIVQAMAVAAQQAGVGPFAAVAGAIAEYVGQELLSFSAELIIENGGDIFAASARSRVFGIYAGSSPLTGKIALKLDAGQMPCGVCTSSGTVGHSLSFGKADAAIVMARSATLADACATALGNLIRSAEDIPAGLYFAETTPGLDGAVVIVGEKLGAWGAIQFVKTAVQNYKDVS